VFLVAYRSSSQDFGTISKLIGSLCQFDSFFELKFLLHLLLCKCMHSIKIIETQSGSTSKTYTDTFITTLLTDYLQARTISQDSSKQGPPPTLSAFIAESLSLLVGTF
jgi:hypothetical protein